MADFRFISIVPDPLLKPFVAKIHVFESSGRLPVIEKKLIVPNANFKLTLTYRNGIVAGIGHNIFTQDENRLSLSGLIDLPVNLDPKDDAVTGTIIIEFNPLGLYRFFHLSFAEVKNQIVPLDEIIGHRAMALEAQLADATTGNLKLQLLQSFLIKRLEMGSPDLIYDYCINRISASNGQVSVAQLEKETGYSSRWLHKKFLEHLGTGPKNLSEIVRFKQIYQAYSMGIDIKGLKDQIYHNYHDQSHFIKAFRRFTGSSPTDLQNSVNELSTKNFMS